MYWKLKGGIQKILSILPGGEHLNDRLQMMAGLRHFEQNVAGKVGDWKQTCTYLADVGFSFHKATIVEVGTGWYPVLPICFSLAGVGCIKTYDIHRHMNVDLTKRALDCIGSHLDAIAERASSSRAEVAENYEQLRKAPNLEELRRLARIEYFAPGDARSTGLPANSVDLVYSNSVFEHVPKQAIFEILSESQRILKRGGIALHNVGCNDHYAFVDPKISFVNFLRFTESEWRLWNNSLQYQNRLRAPQFLKMAQDAGLKPIYHRTHVRPGSREALSQFEVAPEFRDFSAEDLATTSLDFISQKLA